jgi:TonB family protein
MKSHLLAGISLSAAVHAGAVVLIGAWLSRQTTGLPHESQVIAEVVFSLETGTETIAQEVLTSEERKLEPETEPQLPAQPPMEAEETSPAPVIAEAPRAIGPPEPAAPPNKFVQQIPAAGSSKSQSGHRSAGSPAGAPRGLVRGAMAANYRMRASLSYPSSALRDRAGGRVVLSVDVDENGRAINVAVKLSSGRADLDSAAIACARQSSYEPYRAGGIAQACRVEAPFEFKISAAKSWNR